MREDCGEGLGAEGGGAGDQGEDGVGGDADCGGVGWGVEDGGVYEEVFALGDFERSGDVEEGFWVEVFVDNALGGWCPQGLKPSS